MRKKKLTKTETIEHLKKELGKYKKLSFFDDLTKLFNHRKLERDLSRVCYDYKRYKHKFAVILFDIDDFKKINDTKGHLEGDKTLIGVANAIKEGIRKSDRAYRYYEGDEFIVILLHATLTNAKIIAKRIIKKCKVKLSFGVGIDVNPKALLQKIDRDMYKKKKIKKKMLDKEQIV